MDIGEQKPKPTIEELIQYVEADWGRIPERWIHWKDLEAEILATLRLVPKLMKVVEAARDIDFGFVTGRRAPERATLVEMDDQLQRLKASLAALDAGEGGT